MRSSRRENFSAISGHKVWKHRAQLMLTPRAMRAQMKADKCLRLTKFDAMLTEEETSVLEQWALNEQALSGRPKTQSWDNGGRGSIGDCSPIPDAWMRRLNRHSRIKAELDDETREILAAFARIQNREIGALSPAQYGFIFRPTVRNKNEAFFRATIECARLLVAAKY